VEPDVGGDHADEPHPTLITESGRAITAHGSVLVFDVIGRSGIDDAPADRPDPRAAIGAHRDAGEDVPQPVLDLLDAYETIAGPGLTGAVAAQAYHDAEQARAEALSLFKLGPSGCTPGWRVWCSRRPSREITPSSAT